MNIITVGIDLAKNVFARTFLPSTASMKPANRNWLNPKSRATSYCS